MSGLYDSNTTTNSDRSEVVITDETSGVYAGVELIDGKKRLLTSSITVVDQILGKSGFADSWFRIENTGAQNDTLTLTISATTNDPSSPNRDRPLYQKVFTVQAGEVGDEIALRDRIITELKADVELKHSFR